MALQIRHGTRDKTVRIWCTDDNRTCLKSHYAINVIVSKLYSVYFLVRVKLNAKCFHFENVKDESALCSSWFEFMEKEKKSMLKEHKSQL